MEKSRLGCSPSRLGEGSADSRPIECQCMGPRTAQTSAPDRTDESNHRKDTRAEEFVRNKRRWRKAWDMRSQPPNSTGWRLRDQVTVNKRGLESHAEWLGGIVGNRGDDVDW